MNTIIAESVLRILVRRRNLPSATGRQARAMAHDLLKWIKQRRSQVGAC